MDILEKEIKEIKSHKPMVVLTICLSIIILISVYLIVIESNSKKSSVKGLQTNNFTARGMGLNYDVKTIGGYSNLCNKNTNNNDNSKFCSNFDIANIPTSLLGQSIIPSAGTIDHNKLFILGTTPNVVYVFDIHDSKNIKFLTSQKISENLADRNGSIKVLGNELFISDKNSINIFDIYNISNIKKISTISQVNDLLSWDIYNDFIYISMMDSKLINVYDISSPQSPKKLDGFLSEDNIVNNMQISGGKIIFSTKSKENNSYSLVNIYYIDNHGSIQKSSLQQLPKFSTNDLVLKTQDNKLYIVAKDMNFNGQKLWVFANQNDQYEHLTTVELGQKLVININTDPTNIYLQVGYTSSNTFDKINFNFETKTYKIDNFSTNVEVQPLVELNDNSNIYLLGSYSGHAIEVINKNQ